MGTLDQLVGLSDDLGKLDIYVEQITRKVATYMGEVLEDQRDKLQENLLANNGNNAIIIVAEGNNYLIINIFFSRINFICNSISMGHGQISD